MEETYEIEIEKNKFILPLVKTNKVFYYSLNLLGESNLNHIVANALYKKISKLNMHIDTILTVESKAIALAENLASLLNINKYIVVRKNIKSYMKIPIIVSEKTIISGECQYVIDEPDLIELENKNILILDDVVSTGGTIKALFKILAKISHKKIAIACCLTEGEERTQIDDVPLISCGFIPLFNNKGEKI